MPSCALRWRASTTNGWECRTPKEDPGGDPQRIRKLHEDLDREVRLAALDALEESEIQVREFRELLLREPTSHATAGHVRADVVEDVPDPDARHRASVPRTGVTYNGSYAVLESSAKRRRVREGLHAEPGCGTKQWKRSPGRRP
jgi:hypothetical protein